MNRTTAGIVRERRRFRPANARDNGQPTANLGIGGSADSSLAKAVKGFVLGQADDWLSGGVLPLGVEGPRPDASFAPSEHAPARQHNS